MEINYVLSTYPSLLQNMVAKVYETSAPSAEVDSFTIVETDAAGTPDPGGGHNKQATVTFTGLDLVPHILRLYTAGGTLLHEFNVSPSRNAVTVYQPIYFEIGDAGADTPAAGASLYTNSNLAGLTNSDLIIHRSGSLMYPGKHYDAEPSGGFQLLVSGDIFGDEEEFLIEVKPVVSSELINDSVVGKQWGPTTGAPNIYLTVTGTVSYAATHLRKVIRISGSGAYHFDSAVPIGYPFRFINMVSGNPVIHFDTAALIQPGGDVATIVVPTGGIIEVVFDGTKFNLTMNNTDSIGNMPYASITYRGTYDIGDVFYNQMYTVTVPDQGTSNYVVVGSFQSKSGASVPQRVLDCTILHSIDSKSATSYVLHVREEQGVIQNLLWDYVIIKLN